jgi:putative hydrolase of the HAD superfamily
MLVCFDLDGTLLDQRSAEHAGALHFAETFKNRVPVTGDAFAQLWHETTERHFQAFLRGECSFIEQRRHRIGELVSERLEDREADELFNIYLEAYEANWQLFDDVKPCLEALSGTHLGIITNAAQQQQERKLGRLGIAHHFSFVLSAERAGYAKPHPAIFQQAARLAQVEGPRVYIGDDAKTDAQAATDAGWHGIWLNRRGKGEPNFAPMLRGLETLPKTLSRLFIDDKQE